MITCRNFEKSHKLLSIRLLREEMTQYNSSGERELYNDSSHASVLTFGEFWINLMRKEN